MAAPVVRIELSTGLLRNVCCYTCSWKNWHTPNHNERRTIWSKKSIKFDSLHDQCVSSGISAFVPTAVSNARLSGPSRTLGRAVSRVFDTKTVSRMYSYSSSSLTETELKKEVESLSDLFLETRELLDDARTSFGSVYFNEDLSEAEESLNETLRQYAALLEKLSEAQRQQVKRSIGLKMEELKAQQIMIMDTIKED